MAEVLYGIASVVHTPLKWTWVPTEFLTAQRIRAYSDMPIWRPASPGYEGFARFDLTREVAAGLTFRTLADTAQATLDFHFSRPAAQQAFVSPGISAQREAEVLKAWHSR
jgi:2'-hydroxyisoflavone reductase